MEQKKVVITGVSRGIGRAIGEKLLEMGWKVIGVSSSPSPLTTFQIDLKNRREIEKIASQIGEVDALVNNAGVGYFGQLENLSLNQIEEMVKVNLLAPLLLTRLLLPGIKKRGGIILNIGSTSGEEPARLGSVYGATKGGLHHFGESLFQEVRKEGVKVVTIIPDLTKTPFYRNTFFEPSPMEGYHLQPEDIAQIVEMVFTLPFGVVPTKIVVKPQFFGIEKRKRRK
ncbi:MAG: 3-oxoacyl-ACP reductase [Epsilonproteobacteria bacterium]|jgi:short-subunit dehydrogenase|nr:3-oxoacyl-ACP reductase [Campylobacterota bacterium]NPA88682.1 SDR family oxidoreductase [Campylobacterota bacterium]